MVDIKSTCIYIIYSFTQNRPVAGYMNFCPLSLQKDSDDKRIIFIAKHELTHALVGTNSNIHLTSRYAYILYI